MSILQTAKLNGLESIKTLENILLTRKKNLLPMTIGPPEIDTIPSTEDYTGKIAPRNNSKKKLLLPSAVY